MKTLYVSDLDGTLLNESDVLSEYTVCTLNRLIDEGMCFSYATARSLSSASVVTAGLRTDIPVIVYNGTCIVSAGTGEVLSSMQFGEEEKEAATTIFKSSSIHPLVYARVDGQERVSWMAGTENPGMERYLNMKKGDRRLRRVDDISELYKGDVFYLTCIGGKEELLPVYHYFQMHKEYTCLLQQELYREEYWCEIMHREATKGNAVLRLKGLLGCERVVSFGDALNDIPLFEASDQAYAVSNAIDELKTRATAVILSNREDGVARWLEEHYHRV